ncbi:accessory Sec system protein Asp3 [Streptococcus uberis]|nr:accessory Sec system protein Asp3 [Streptococcus uberis]
MLRCCGKALTDLERMTKMSKKAIAHLRWNSISPGGSYLYGSQIQIFQEGVLLDNPLMAPGKPLRTYQSRTNYQGNRKSPDLPVLKPGDRYRLELHLETFPEKCYYLQLEFFNRQGERLEEIILRDNELVFKCPDETFSYSLKLVSAGCQKLIFCSIDLYHLQDVYSGEEKPIVRRYPKGFLPDEISLVQPLIESENL